MEEQDLEQIDFTRPITLFSQTTKSTRGFYNLKKMLEEKVSAYKEENLDDFKANDSICRQVSNREPQLTKFSNEHDVILFVSGVKSSNGKALYQVCKSINENSYFIQSEEDLKAEWFEDAETVGICGATSTPTWLMEKVKDRLEEEQFMNETN